MSLFPEMKVYILQTVRGRTFLASANLLPYSTYYKLMMYYKPTPLLSSKFSYRYRTLIPYSTYYKPMGDLSYISSEQGGGLIIHHGLVMRITIYKRPIPIQ